MHQQIKCAVVGAGSWGTTAHVPALKQHPNAQLVAVQHRDVNTAKKVARDFDVPHGVAELDDVLSIQGLQAVVISSTPNMHYRQAKTALERNLHVLLEKPMTFNVKQAAELVELARDRGLCFMVGCTWHFTEHAFIAQRLVQSGELGEIRMICVWMMDYCMGLYQSLDWEQMFPSSEFGPKPYLEPESSSYSDPSISGGGQIFAQVSHPAAYLTFLTGQEPVEVHANFSNGGTAVDVYNTLTIKLARGTLVSLASTGDTGKTPRNLNVRVFGSKAVLEMELFGGKMNLRTHLGKIIDYPDLQPEECYPERAPALNFIDAITGAAPNRSPATLGLSAMKIIEGACQSARSGKCIAI